jgi:hypothetical protein
MERQSNLQLPGLLATGSNYQYAMTTDAMPKPYRYAVYFAPDPSSLWWQAGSQWLGRCAAGQGVGLAPVVEGVSDYDFRRVTSAPRRYGWHATLKAPFALAIDVTVQQLESALKSIAQSTRAFDMPRLEVALLDDFLAVVPQPVSHAADAIAARCVRELQPFAAPLSDSELQRRRQTPLTAEQDALLLRWGYPFVLTQYQLHCSLTGSLSSLSRQQVNSLELAAHDWFNPLPTCRFESLALFVESSAGADFRLQAHFAFQP